MKKYLEFINESSNHDIISNIKDIILEIEDSGLSVNYFYLDNHKSTFPSDLFNNIIIEIFPGDFYSGKEFKLESDIIDTLYRIGHYLSIKGYKLNIEFNQDYERVYRVDSSTKSIDRFKGNIINRIILRVDFKINENLDFFNSSDFKGVWGVESSLAESAIFKYFEFFKNSLIDLIDDGYVTKYQFLFTKDSNENFFIRTYIYNSYIDSENNKRIEDFVNSVKEQATVLGKIDGYISISTVISLYQDDVTDIISNILECVKFMKDNGVDNGFECNTKLENPNSIRISIKMRV